MIELVGIEKTYGAGGTATPVLRGISFRIEAGEYVAIMGASGTGKSTLLHILGTLDKPSAGAYRLEGTDLASLDDDALSEVRNRTIGFVFQQFHLLDRATTLQNVLLPLLYAEPYPTDARERAEKAIGAVGMSDRIQYKPSQLSGGQQQRVAIARALINDPHLILADEPTGNLDSRNGLEILSIFQSLHRQGRTLIVVTHDAAVAEHAGRILVLRDGAVAEDGKVAQPRNADAELAALPKPEGQA